MTGQAAVHARAAATRRRAARALCRTALQRLHTGMGDAHAGIEQALRIDTACLPAHCLRAALYVMSGSESARELLARALAEASRWLDAASVREHRHLTAARDWIEHDLQTALRSYGRIVEVDAHDTLALRVAHQGDLHWGRTGMLRDRVAAALPRWQPTQPGYAHVLAMYAFGLAENGNFARAEEVALRALAIEPRHAGALHALAHVYEMQDRCVEGIERLSAACEWWSTSPTHAVHLWWHLALFRFERCEIAAALRILDEHLLTAIDPTPANCVDATALLWRLQLHGIALAPAWQRVADAWERQPLGAQRPFNDAHAMLALVAAGRWASAQRLTEALRERASRLGNPQRVVQESAMHVCEALLAFGEGRYRDASAWLHELRHLSQRCGGSQAQCELLQLTWLEAALRAGQLSLAQELLDQRCQRRPRSALNTWLCDRVAEAGRTVNSTLPRPGEGCGTWSGARQGNVGMHRTPAWA